MQHCIRLGITAAAVSAMLAGCTTTASRTDLSDRLASAERDNSELRSSLQRLQQSVSAKDQRIASLQRPGAGDAEVLPPGAKPGECYARAFLPPTYKPVSRAVLKRDAGERIETTARYRWAEKRVLVQEGSERLEVVPATYAWKEERVLVKEASTRLDEVPAVYETVAEKVRVRDGYTTWKKGRGPIERIDHATGEIMCLVEVPPAYETVTKRVLKTPASVRRVEIPAEYRIVKRRVVTEPPKTVKVAVPARYETLRVRELVEPSQERRIAIPAEYQEVSDRVLVAEGRLEWRPILCETNTSPEVVRKLQSALQQAGHDPGEIDGILGRDTLAAVDAYQKANGLATGQLTMETLRRLKVI